MTFKSGKFPLRLILTLPFVIQLFGIVGLVGYLSFRNSQKAVNDLATQLRGELTARIQQQLHDYIEVPFIINQMNAASLAKGQIDLKQTADAYPLWQQANAFPDNNLIYCGAEADGTFLGVGRSNDFKERVIEIQLSNPSTNFVFHYYSLDDTGGIIRRRKIGDRRYDPRIRPWYQAAKAKGQATWSEIYLDFDALVPVLTASVPVYSPTDRRLLGVCATDFLLSVELDEMLSTLEIGQSGETFIIERSGTLVSSSTVTEEALLVGQGENAQRLKAVDSQNALVRGTAAYLFEQFGDLNQIQTTQQLNFNLEGDRQFVQVVPFQDNRGLDWLIVVVVPEADFMSQIYANNRNTLLLSLAALGLAVGLGVLTARRITQPIQRLSEASRLLADEATTAHLGKDLKQVNATGRIRELDVLMQSFNQMAGQLKDAFHSLARANEELEHRVEQRTLELKQANAEIIKLNGQLQAENVRMSAELNVARQLQQMILPREHELTQISDLEIAGLMQSADEVGGDYYDIIAQGDRVHIGIGDVTGHGLKSGVLMMMTQTAVRTLLALDERDPVKMLNGVNQVIYQNVQRMEPGRNLTLALLDYQPGRLFLSGQHEEVLVVRANGAIERVDTLDLGFPLGMVEDIADLVNQQQILLEPGDGVVLYTDGITEAEGANRQLYGLERLMALVQQHWHHSAQAITQAVLADVRSHVGAQPIYDDITLVVLKRKTHNYGNTNLKSVASINAES